MKDPKFKKKRDRFLYKKFLERKDSVNIARSNMPEIEMKYRECLYCENEFLSEGAHNRICRTCKQHKEEF